MTTAKRGQRIDLFLIGIAFLSAFLNMFNIWNDAYANAYYTAAVTSMVQSFHNFFFASFDPAGFVTVDKPPVTFWVQTLFAKVLGVHGWSVILPQALAGVGSVLLIYRLVKPSFGLAAARWASLVMAVTPIAVAVARTNNVDALLVFTLLLAAWMLFKGIRVKKPGWIIGAFVMIGVGFNEKMLQAYMVAPAFYLFYLLAYKVQWKKKLAVLAAATAIMVGVSLSWAVIVDSIPQENRPYMGSSQTNSVLELAFGYNGISRLTGNRGTGGGGQLPDQQRGSESSGQQAVPQDGSMPSGQQAMPQDGSMPSGQQAVPQDGSMPSGQQAMSQDGSTPSGQQAVPQDGSTPSGQQAMPQDGSTPSGQQTAPQDGSTPSGQQAVPQGGSTPSGQQAVPQDGSTPSGQQAVPQGGSTPSGQQAVPQDGSTPSGQQAVPQDGSTPSGQQTAPQSFAPDGGDAGQMPGDDGRDGGRAGGGGMGGAFGTGTAGPLRLFQTELSGQASWLLPFVGFACVGLLAGIRRRKALTDKQAESLFWLAWLLPAMAFFSVAGFFHHYYLIMLAPAIAALTGAGWVELWNQYRSRDSWQMWLLPAGLLAATAFELYVLQPYQSQIGIGWSIGIGAAGAVLSLTLFLAAGTRELVRAAAIAGMAALLVAPTFWATTPIVYGGNSMLPQAGPGQAGGMGGGQPPRFMGGNGGTDAGRTDGGQQGNMADGQTSGSDFAGSDERGPANKEGRTAGGNARQTQGMGGMGTNVNEQLLDYVTTNNTGETYLFATSSATTAQGYIIRTGKAVMAMGGFSGSDPILTVDKLEQLVKNKEVKYFLVSSGGPGGGSSELTAWIREHGTEVPKEEWQQTQSNGQSQPQDGRGGGPGMGAEMLYLINE